MKEKEGNPGEGGGSRGGKKKYYNGEEFEPMITDVVEVDLRIRLAELNRLYAILLRRLLTIIIISGARELLLPSFIAFPHLGRKITNNNYT